MVKISPSEITPEHVFLNRRKFMKGVGATAGAMALAACQMPAAPPPPKADGEAVSLPSPDELPAALAHTDAFASAETDELGGKLNTLEEITNYNNYYEFTLSKEAVNGMSQNFQTRPWAVEVTGMVNKPKTFDIDDIIQGFTQEERIYRLRCVEAWSMVIPWVGFSVGDLLKEVEPTADAKYVRFETIYDPEQMPGQKSGGLNWPYVEGLTVEEAMNPLATLATGIYGKPLHNANGAPFRLVVPWKYGFKSIKAVVKIELTDEMPVSTWTAAAPNEYGFYSNVNPNVNHPRWSQATERRIGGGLGRIDTLMFNGYEEEVAYLYEGLDLKVNY